jgi:hypothetical protein
MEDVRTSSSTESAACSAEALRELRERARAARTAERDEMSQLERRLTEQLDVLAAEIARQRAEDAAQLRDQLGDAQATWREERSQQEAALAKVRQQLDARDSELDQRVSGLDARERAQNEREAGLQKREAALHDQNQRLDEREQQIASAEQRTGADREELAQQREAWAAEQAAHEAARKEMAAALAEASQRLEFVRQQADDATENESLQHKFDLALQDVRRLRSRVAELEQELARRPEADQADSAELVHLRAERDALAQRVEELEREPARPLDSSTEQEVADLQRRFELAVEDVRDLKKKNTQLESRLAEAAKKAVSTADSSSMDWEAQKKRLLASLENEGESGDPARQKERVAIEGTIRITDEVVAGKDDEITSLREQLAVFRAAGGKVGVDRERESAITRLIDEDEVIQQHRKRAAQLEQEMEEKLRAAELELSVERAKLARQQAELADTRLELESIHKSRDSSGGHVPADAPKRRWLSKLGLSGDDEKK